MGSFYFADIVSSDIGASFELELGGDELSIEFAVVPLEEGSEVFADEAHESTKQY